MATFLDIVNNVIDATGRDDKEAYIRRKVSAAIRWLASSGAFPDTHVDWVFEAADGIDNQVYTQSVTKPSDLRKINYIKYPEAVSAIEITGLSTDDLALYNLANVQDKFYMTGNLIHIRNSVLTSQVLMGYYAYPAELADGESNWITNSAEDIIEELVNLQVLALTGQKAASNSVAAITNELIRSFRDDRAIGFIEGSLR